MLWQDIRHAARVLVQNLVFTALAVLTLALGIGANTAIFSVVNAVLIRPLPYHQPERLVAVWEKGQDGRESNTSYATYVDWRSRSHSLADMAVMGFWQPTLTGTHEPERLEGMKVSPTFFGMLGVRPLLGRDFIAEDDRRGSDRAVILSYGLWKRRFGGSTQAIGKPIEFSGVPFTVVGVLPPTFEPLFSTNLAKPAEVWTPLRYDSTLPWACRDCRHLRTVARLAPDVSLAQARAEMNRISIQLFQEYPKEYPTSGVVITKLQDQFVGGIRPALLILLGAVSFVLLIACANVANLTLSHAARRQREFAVRRALGAGTPRLMRQLLTECLLLSLVGGVAGLLLAYWGTSALVAMSPPNLPRLDGVHVDGWVLGFSAAISLLTGLIFGMAPALQAARLNVSDSLKKGSRSSTGPQSRRLYNLLIAANVCFALVLLVGAGLMIKSLYRLLRVDAGFETKNLLTLNVSYLGASYPDRVPCADGPCRKALNFYEDSIHKLQGLPGIESAGIVSQLPLGGNHDGNGIHPEGRLALNPQDDPSGDRYAISTGYLHTMRIPLLRGRSFTGADAGNVPLVVLVNNAAAQKVWPGENAVGKRVKVGDPNLPWRTVVGVVGDVRHKGLDKPQSLQLYLPLAQWPDSSTVFVVRTSRDPGSFSSAVRETIAVTDRNVTISNIAPMEQVVAVSIAERRFTEFLFTVFSMIALLLAGAGIYGTISYSVTHRTREIGVRMALGAQTLDVLRLVVSEGMRPVFLGIVSGLAAALALGPLMAGLLFEVRPGDPITIAAVTFLLAIVSFFASYLPARRATRVDPLIALRYE